MMILDEKTVEKIIYFNQTAEKVINSESVKSCFYI